VLPRQRDRAGGLHFGRDGVLADLGPLFRETKLAIEVVERTDIQNARLLEEFPPGGGDNIGVFGLDLSGDRLPDRSPIGRPPEQQDLDPGSSGVDDDLDLENAGGFHPQFQYSAGVIGIGDTMRIPPDEITLTVSTSRGPGGQNVNRVRTRVTATFNVVRSPSLTEEERARIIDRLGSRIDGRGNLRVRSQKHRTQLRNREEALTRLGDLVGEALRERPQRRKSRKPKAAEERRLEEKRRRSRLKEARSRTEDSAE